jgi:hypothetical protein
MPNDEVRIHNWSVFRFAIRTLTRGLFTRVSLLLGYKVSSRALIVANSIKYRFNRAHYLAHRSQETVHYLDFYKNVDQSIY